MWKPPGVNSQGECDTAASNETHFLAVPFTAQEEAIHIVEALFPPEWYESARVYVYTGDFKAGESCYCLNVTRTLDASSTFRIAMLLEKGAHMFVVTGLYNKHTGKPGDGPFALRIDVSELAGIAYSPQHQAVQWQPPVLSAGAYNCSNVGNATAYLGHVWPVANTGAHDISVWLTGQPGANVRSTIYVFDGILSATAPAACGQAAFHDGHKALGHFNSFPTVLLKNHNYTIVVVFDWQTAPTEEYLYGVQIAPSDRYSTNNSYAPYNVVNEQHALAANCTPSGVLNPYQYITFTAHYVLHAFDFFDAFDGNHTVLSVYEGAVGGSKTTPPATCDNWLGSTRSYDLEPWRGRSLFLALKVGTNYTVIVASALPNSAGIFRPAVFTGTSVNPTPPPPTTTTVVTTTGHHGTTGHATTTAAATATTGTGAATTGHIHHKNDMQGWEVALIVVASLAGAAVIVGAVAYYVLVVRKRPQYELIN